MESTNENDYRLIHPLFFRLESAVVLIVESGTINHYARSPS